MWYIWDPRIMGALIAALVAYVYASFDTIISESLGVHIKPLSPPCDESTSNSISDQQRYAVVIDRLAESKSYSRSSGTSIIIYAAYGIFLMRSFFPEGPILMVDYLWAAGASILGVVFGLWKPHIPWVKQVHQTRRDLLSLSGYFDRSTSSFEGRPGMDLRKWLAEYEDGAFYFSKLKQRAQVQHAQLVVAFYALYACELVVLFINRF